MGLEHELTVRYAAGSLGGTLGRLQDSLRRLSRKRLAFFRGETGEVERFPKPVDLANLNQMLRLMTDAWLSFKTASPRFSQLDARLESLKAAALDRLSDRRGRPAEYHRLALVLDRLRVFEFGRFRRPGKGALSGFRP